MLFLQWTKLDARQIIFQLFHSISKTFLLYAFNANTNYFEYLNGNIKNIIIPNFHIASWNSWVTTPRNANKD